MGRSEVKKIVEVDESKGLGKNEDGISTAIKPSLKFDNHGIGHDSSKEFTSQWWNYAFNKAANSINVIHSENGVVVKVKQEKRKKKIQSKILAGFVKAETPVSESHHLYCVAETTKKTFDILSNSSIMTDEELFKSCDGRTAHKSARFISKWNGKLQRIKEQEKKFVSPACDDNGISDKNVDTKSISHEHIKKYRERKRTRLI